MRGLLIFLLAGLIGCASPKYISVKISGSDKPSKVKALGEFSRQDYEDIKKALKMISTLTPEMTFTNSPKMSWMESKEFAGITFMSSPKEIFIDKELKIKKGSKLEYFRLGAIGAHELSHFERGMTEPEVNELIDKPLFLLLQNKYQDIINFDWK